MPRLNGKVERSHLTDHQEFYQFLNHKDDVDLPEKLSQWENFYNFERPHGAHAGKAPHEVLKLAYKPDQYVCFRQMYDEAEPNSATTTNCLFSPTHTVLKNK